VSGELAAFVGVSLLVIATPGQDTALTIRNTLLGGRRVGVSTALGVSTGQASWTLAASAGVAALLVASEPAFLAVKLLGAAYLVYLGVEALLAAARSGASERFAIARGRIRHLAPGTAYRQGVVSNLGNPKMAVFFTSLLPQFAPSGAGSFWAMLVLGLLFCSFTLVWLAGYAVAVAKAGDLLRRPKIRRSLEGLMGAVLMALGLRLASEGR
jgi:threonine/homoserine/homoserine lactone efflux protein